MNNKSMLQKISEETMRFMRGKYVLDEIGDGKDELKFRRSGKTVLTIYIRDDRFDFLVIFGKAEREKFDVRRGEFSQKIQAIYNSSKTYHDGKWMMIPVTDLETLEAVKQMIMIKKKPNRKPFPKTHIHSGNCGHRCDLCVHYKDTTSISAKEMEYARVCCTAVYSVSDWEMYCDGCHWPDCTVESALCRKAKGRDKCSDCNNFEICLKTAGCPPTIHTRKITGDEVTWAILPYVKGQYGN